MSKPIPSVAIIGSILGLISKGKGIQKAYPAKTVLIVAYISFMIGAVMISLEPKRLQNIEKEIPQHEPYTMSMEKDLVKRVEQARNIEGVITSEPYLAWVYNEIDDSIDKKQHLFNHELTVTTAVLCFQRGCIFGSMYPERTESMYRADYPSPNTLSWEDLVEVTKQWLKNGSFN